MNHSERMRKIDELRTCEANLYESVKHGNRDSVVCGYMALRQLALLEIVAEYKDDIARLDPKELAYGLKIRRDRI